MSSSFLRSLQQTKVQCQQSSLWSTNELLEHFQSINEGLLRGVQCSLLPKGSYRAFLLYRVDSFPIVEQPLLSSPITIHLPETPRACTVRAELHAADWERG